MRLTLIKTTMSPIFRYLASRWRWHPIRLSTICTGQPESQFVADYLGKKNISHKYGGLRCIEIIFVIRTIPNLVMSWSHMHIEGRVIAGPAFKYINVSNSVLFFPFPMCFFLSFLFIRITFWNDVYRIAAYDRYPFIGFTL